MKYLKQFLLILLISFVGELLHECLPLPVPASVYGFAILLAGLISGVIHLDHVYEAGNFLIEIMPVMFIPAGVGLLESWNVLAPIFGPVLVITLVSTVIVLAISGCVTQVVIRKDKKKVPNKNMEGDVSV